MWLLGIRVHKNDLIKISFIILFIPQLYKEISIAGQAQAIFIMLLYCKQYTVT